MKSIGVLFLVIGLSGPASYAGNDGHGGDIACQDRVELIRNNLEERIKDGGASTLDFARTDTTAEVYTEKIPKIMDLTREQQSSISCTSNPQEVSALVGGTWMPICAAEWLDNKSVKPDDRAKPKILCYTGVEKNGEYTGGLMGMSGTEQYGQLDHEFNVLAGFEDQKGEYSHYLIASRISEKARATTYWLWPAVVPVATTPNPKIFGEWETKEDMPSVGSSNIWHYDFRISLQGTKMVEQLTCHFGAGSATATVSVPIIVTATQIIPKYGALQDVPFRVGVFGAEESCNLWLQNHPIDYIFDGANGTITFDQSQPYNHIHYSKLGNYPLSPPWDE